MTLDTFMTESRHYASEFWWNGAATVIVAFLLVSFIWRRPGNEELLYVALAIAIIHAYVSSMHFGRSRIEEQDRHRQELAVAYREHLRMVRSEEKASAQNRPPAGRNGSAPRRMEHTPHRFVGIPAH